MKARNNAHLKVRGEDCGRPRRTLYVHHFFRRVHTVHCLTLVEVLNADDVLYGALVGGSRLCGCRTVIDFRTDRRDCHGCWLQSWGDARGREGPHEREKSALLSGGRAHAHLAYGAQATTPEGMQICESTGKKQTLSFVRPSGVSGAELDYQYALQFQRLELLRRQLSVSTYPGLRQQEQAEYEAQQRRMEEYRQSIQNSFRTEQLRLNCTSQAVGQFIYTNCR